MEIRAEEQTRLIDDKLATKFDLELLKRDLKIWFGSAMVVGVGVILAAIRYLPGAHSQAGVR